MTTEPDDLDEFARPIGTGMTRTNVVHVPSPEVAARLEEFARVRLRGEVEGRTFYVG